MNLFCNGRWCVKDHRRNSNDLLRWHVVTQKIGHKCLGEFFFFYWYVRICFTNYSEPQFHQNHASSRCTTAFGLCGFKTDTWIWKDIRSTTTAIQNVITNGSDNRQRSGLWYNRIEIKLHLILKTAFILAFYSTQGV